MTKHDVYFTRPHIAIAHCTMCILFTNSTIIYTIQQHLHAIVYESHSLQLQVERVLSICDHPPRNQCKVTLGVFFSSCYI